jgi:hypothetical protein
VGLKKFRKVRVRDENYVNVFVVCNNYDRINRENKEFNTMNFKLGIYEKNAISIHTGLNLSLVRNRLKHGKCCKCGRNNSCKNIQILCPECMEEAVLSSTS